MFGSRHPQAAGLGFASIRRASLLLPSLVCAGCKAPKPPLRGLFLCACCIIGGERATGRRAVRGRSYLCGLCVRSCHQKAAANARKAIVAITNRYPSCSIRVPPCRSPMRPEMQRLCKRNRPKISRHEKDLWPLGRGRSRQKRAFPSHRLLSPSLHASCRNDGRSADAAQSRGQSRHAESQLPCRFRVQRWPKSQRRTCAASGRWSEHCSGRICGASRRRPSVTRM